MMNKEKYAGYQDVQGVTGDIEVIEPGAYVCRIKKVSVEEKTYGDLLVIEFDIAEGPRAGFYQRKFDAFQKWTGVYYQTAMKDPEKMKFFKGFITAIEKSNDGFTWNWNEQELVGKYFAGVFAEEEYRNNEGEIKVSCKCRSVRSMDQLREGKIKIPEIKRLEVENTGFVAVGEVSNDELPF